jgi:hypothetical protein
MGISNFARFFSKLFQTFDIYSIVVKMIICTISLRIFWCMNQFSAVIFARAMRVKLEASE